MRYTIKRNSKTKRVKNKRNSKTKRKVGMLLSGKVHENASPENINQIQKYREMLYKQSNITNRIIKGGMQFGRVLENVASNENDNQLELYRSRLSEITPQQTMLMIRSRSYRAGLFALLNVCEREVTPGKPDKVIFKEQLIMKPELSDIVSTVKELSINKAFTGWISNEHRTTILSSVLGLKGYMDLMVLKAICDGVASKSICRFQINTRNLREPTMDVYPLLDTQNAILSVQGIDGSDAEPKALVRLNSFSYASSGEKGGKIIISKLKLFFIFLANVIRRFYPIFMQQYVNFFSRMFNLDEGTQITNEILGRLTSGCPFSINVYQTGEFHTFTMNIKCQQIVEGGVPLEVERACQLSFFSNFVQLYDSALYIASVFFLEGLEQQAGEPFETYIQRIKVHCAKGYALNELGRGPPLNQQEWDADPVLVSAYEKHFSSLNPIGEIRGMIRFRNLIMADILIYCISERTHYALSNIEFGFWGPCCVKYSHDTADNSDRIKPEDKRFIASLRADPKNITTTLACSCVPVTITKNATATRDGGATQELLYINFQTFDFTRQGLGDSTTFDSKLLSCFIGADPPYTVIDYETNYLSKHSIKSDTRSIVDKDCSIAEGPDSGGLTKFMKVGSTVYGVMPGTVVHNIKIITALDNSRYFTLDFGTIATYSDALKKKSLSEFSDQLLVRYNPPECYTNNHAFVCYISEKYEVIGIEDAKEFNLWKLIYIKGDLYTAYQRIIPDHISVQLDPIAEDLKKCKLPECLHKLLEILYPLSSVDEINARSQEDLDKEEKKYEKKKKKKSLNNEPIPVSRPLRVRLESYYKSNPINDETPSFLSRMNRHLNIICSQPNTTSFIYQCALVMALMRVSNSAQNYQIGLLPVIEPELTRLGKIFEEYIQAKSGVTHAPKKVTRRR